VDDESLVHLENRHPVSRTDVNNEPTRDAGSRNDVARLITSCS